MQNDTYVKVLIYAGELNRMDSIGHGVGTTNGRPSWSTNLFDVCADGGCDGFCYAIWCPSCMYGSTVQALRRGSCLCAGQYYFPCIVRAAASPAILAGASIIATFKVALLVGLARVVLSPVVSAGLHYPVRKAIKEGWYGIQDDSSGPCMDCAITMFCGHCAACQHHRETRIRGLQPTIWAYPVGMQSPQQQVIPPCGIDGNNGRALAAPPPHPPAPEGASPARRHFN